MAESSQSRNTGTGDIGAPASGRPLKARRPALTFLVFALAALGVAALFRLHDPGVPDPDSLYHFRHAALYAENGLLMRAFPWLPYSSINRFSADTGYGFHVFLIPFTFLRDPILGIRLASVCEITLLLLLFYAALGRHRVVFPWAWPFLLLFLSPPTLFGLLMTRPQVLSMGFAALLLSFLVTGTAWGALLAAFGLTFIHFNLFWLVPLVAVLVFIIRLITERVWGWRAPAAALLGMVLGWLLRPNPIGLAKLEQIQFFLHAAVRNKGLPLLFGLEWQTFSLSDLFSLFLSFLLIWATLAGVFLVLLIARRSQLEPQDAALLWSSLLLGLLFFIATIVNTRRSIALWTTYSVFFVGVGFSRFLDPGASGPDRSQRQDARLILPLWVAAIFALMVWDCFSDHLVQRKWLTGDPARLRPAAVWLEGNAQPDAVIYNMTWDVFPELFFWNPGGRYVSGLDPIFLYAYDERLYWKTHHLEAGDAIDRTWGDLERSPAAAKDTYDVLRDDFHASYVILEPKLHARFYGYLETDPRYARRFQDSQAAIYEIRDPEPEG